MLRTIILFAFAIFATAKHSHAATTAINQGTQPNFLDPSCIAVASNTVTTKNSSIANKRFASPTFFDLKVQIQKNLSKFLSTRISAINLATSKQCENPLSDSSCTVVSYKNPDGTSVTAQGVYQFVVFSSLYNYIDSATLDSGQLETARAEFMTGYRSSITPEKFEEYVNAEIAKVNKERAEDDAKLKADEQDKRKGQLTDYEIKWLRIDVTKKYSGIDSVTFNAAIEEAITSSGIVGGMENKSIAAIINLMDSASTIIAAKMSDDGLFLQKLGHSSLVAFPITSRLVECLDGTFRNLFMKDVSKITRRTPFGLAQDYFKPAVILALILYFIAYGYKIVLAHGMGKQSEIIMFAVKFGLVFYFSIGEAWKDFAFDMLKSIPATVSQIVFESLPGSVDGCTAFKPSMYPQGKGMLSFFDTIDCKYANYIGLRSGQSVPAIFSVITIPMLIPVPIVTLLVTTIGFLYFGIVTFGLLIAIEIYISAILFFTFYLFLAPLVVPMALFSKTEDICKKYQTKIIGTVVQAVMSVVMLVMVIALMDGVIYGPNPGGQNLFTPPPQPMVNGIPQPSTLNDNCYPTNGAWEPRGFFGATNTDGLIGVGIPMACMLARISPPSWLSFPVPFVLELFQLPISGSFFTIYFGFFVPGIISILSLFIVNTVTGQISEVINKISGATNTGAFGASSFNPMSQAFSAGKEAVEEGKQVYNAIKESAKEAGKEAVKTVL